MKILVVGSGAREHTLVWKLARSPRVRGLFAAPGNAGTAALANNLPVNASDVPGITAAVRENRIDLVVVGPEGPLSEGITDRLQALGVPVFGATRAAAQIECSKVFAKSLMQRHAIPCAASASFEDYLQARDYIKQQKPPIVVKADGLAAGKGVTVAGSVPEALAALSAMMETRELGEAGRRVIIEEYLPGKEMSAFVFTDGRAVVPMASACDYKRVFDGDSGPNTGGMGAYSPPPFETRGLKKKVMESIMAPAVRAMAAESRPYRGVLYGGLMITAGGPRVLEFNARFGDPETQVILPRLKTDLVEIIMAIVEDRLERQNIEWSDEACVGVVVASGGYPVKYETGFPISGLDSLDKDILVFHAGTGFDSGRVLTAGGRVLTVVALGRTIAEARSKVYANLPRLTFEGCHYRKDIALLADK